jgi:hypothetical protein
MPDTKPSATAELPVVQSTAFVHVYTSNVQIETSVFDVRLTFGDKRSQADGRTYIEQSLEVVMSLQHAKALVLTLAQNLKHYEEQVGEIKLPNRVQPASPPQQPGPTSK